MACDELTQLMDVTEDDILSKKIEKFVHAFKQESDFSRVEHAYFSLVSYLDYVLSSQPEDYPVN